jgi:PleD family two-component response regulator
MPVTISLGVMEYGVPFADLKPEDLISRADAKLYEAKNAGRNCVKF